MTGKRPDRQRNWLDDPTATLLQLGVRSRLGPGPLLSVGPGRRLSAGVSLLGNSDDGRVVAQTTVPSTVATGVLVLSHYLESIYALRLLHSRHSAHASATFSRQRSKATRTRPSRAAFSSRQKTWRRTST